MEKCTVTQIVAGTQATGLRTDICKTQAGILVGSWVSYHTLTSFGLRPAIALGHSFGEYAALMAAGAWSLTDALRAVDPGQHAAHNEED